MRKSNRINTNLPWAPVLAVLLALPAFLACGPPEGPADFKAGEHSCDHCKMGIADLRFRGEAITKKGKVHRFDSIECLLAWSADHPDGLHSRWVADFANSPGWLSLDKAHILYSKELRSPMGAGLSAYKDPAAIATAIKRSGGEELNGPALGTHIQRWRDSMGKSRSHAHGGMPGP